MRATSWQGRLALLTLAHAVGTLNMVSIMAMAPMIQGGLGLSATELGLLVTGYYAGQTLAAVPAGALVDRLGVGRSLVLAAVLLALGVFQVSRAPGLVPAMLGTFVMGLGYSITNPATAKGVLQWFPVERRATAMGVKQTGVPVGGVLAAGNGVLAAFLDWRLVLTAVAIVGLASAGLMALLRDREDEAMPPGGRPGAGAIVAAAREPGVGVLFAAAIPWNMAQTNFFAYLTLFMRDAVQTSQPIAGVALAIGQSASAVGRIGWGVVSDTLFRGARKRLLVALCGAAALLLAAMALVPAGWVLLALGMTLALGLTVASFAALQQTLAVETVAPRHAGSAMGFTLLGSSFGGMIGPPIFGALVDFTGGFGWSWVLTGVLMMVGAVLVAGWLEEHRPADR